MTSCNSTSPKYNNQAQEQSTAKSSMSYTLAKLHSTRSTGRPKTTINSSITTESFRMLSTKLESNAISKSKNQLKLSIKIIWSLPSGSKDITTLIAVIEEATIWQKREEEDKIPTLVLQIKMLSPKPTMPVELLSPKNSLLPRRRKQLLLNPFPKSQ